MLKKSTFREIKSSLGRYLAILAIVALGVGFFSGLKVTRPAMITTADDYLSKSSFFDYQVMNTLGFEEEDVTPQHFLHRKGLPWRSRLLPRSEERR